VPPYARVDAIAGVIVILLSGMGALAAVRAIRRRLGERRHADHDAELDDLGDVGVRAIAAELDAEHDWWQLSLEGLEQEPGLERAVTTLADDDTSIETVVSLSRAREIPDSARSAGAVVATDRPPHGAWTRRTKGDISAARA